MLTKTYLEKVLPELEEFSDAEKFPLQLLEGDGYDEIIAILGSLRSVEFPCVVIEDRSSGIMEHLLEGPVDSTSMALWVMDQGNRDNNPSAIFESSFALAKRILKLLIRDCDKESSLAGWDTGRVAYNKRMGGPKCYGYEIVLSFNENLDLSTNG